MFSLTSISHLHHFRLWICIRGEPSLNIQAELFILAASERLVRTHQRWCTRPFWKQKGGWKMVKGERRSKNSSAGLPGRRGWWRGVEGGWRPIGERERKIERWSQGGARRHKTRKGKMVNCVLIFSIQQGKGAFLLKGQSIKMVYHECAVWYLGAG